MSIRESIFPSTHPGAREAIPDGVRKTLYGELETLLGGLKQATRTYSCLYRARHRRRGFHAYTVFTLSEGAINVCAAKPSKHALRSSLLDGALFLGGESLPDDTAGVYIFRGGLKPGVDIDHMPLRPRPGMHERFLHYASTLDIAPVLPATTLHLADLAASMMIVNSELASAKSR